MKQLLILSGKGGTGKTTTASAFIRFSEARAFTVLGRNKLNIYYGEHIYQIRGGKRFNALKYVHFYHRYKNITTGNEHGKFLGL